jgi:hypothetical protein
VDQSTLKELFMAFENKYTLGRGEIYFARKDPTSGVVGGEGYFGNTPSLNISFEPEKLEHFSSDRGIREKDRSVILQVNRTGSLETDNISPENVALFFFGSTDALTVAQDTVVAESVGGTAGVEVGMFYQLGASPASPSGSREIIYPGAGGTVFVLKKGSTPLVYGVDYTLNAKLGRIEILAGDAVDGDSLTCDYTVAGSNRTRIISGSTPIEGSLRFIAFNPTGENLDYFFPSVTLTPDGEYGLKSDEWQVIPFSVEILKPEGAEAIYIDGRAQTAS